jgi:SynChlorMet cassette protein ScmC
MVYDRRVSLWHQRWDNPMGNACAMFSQESVGLTLSDGSTWGIAACDEGALAIVSLLAETMQLVPQQAPIYRLLVLTDVHGVPQYSADLFYGCRRFVPRFVLSSAGDNTITCILSPKQKKDVLVNQLVQLSLVIAHQSQHTGGILLHGALIEKDGWGVILSGPGGVGKTSASRRLAPPWRCLSDDATLVVRDERGRYVTHPWPTWSELMSGGKGGSWEVSRSAPLKGICLLTQAPENAVEPLGVGESACSLFESSKQASWPLLRYLNSEETRTLHRQRFDNICALVKTVPCFRLRLSLDGAFWEEIERVIIEKDIGVVSSQSLPKTQLLSNDRGPTLTDQNATRSAISNPKCGCLCFCAHVGSSMNPTLNEMDMLEIEPYGSRPIRAGDVIFFRPPDEGRSAIHRVIRVIPNGIQTKGDNSSRMDPWVVHPDDVVGKVVWATQGKSRRSIYGGKAGQLWSFGVKGLKVVEKSLSFFYHGLARSGLFRRLVPLHKRMRIVALRHEDGKVFKLLLGDWLIGTYRPGISYWQIRRPFRLFVDVESLPK